MDEVKSEQLALTSPSYEKGFFAAQAKTEAQIPINPPRWPYLRRLILLLLGLGFSSFAFLHLRWDVDVDTWYSGKHGHNHELGNQIEKDFISVLDARDAMKVSRQYSSIPHLAGSDDDLKNAELFLSILQDSFGIIPPKRAPIFDAGSLESQEATRGITERNVPSAWIDTYYPVMDTPLDRTLQIVDDDEIVLWTADIKEHGDANDPDAFKYADAVPTFHAYSATGNVTAHLVNGSYCSKDDFDRLIMDGAPLNGSIVLCRYGGNFRGLKVKGAQDNGAIGVLIYSDTGDDGVATVENGFVPYPDGPARNPTSVQRGSVEFLSIYPGDPTTPGYPSYENVTRTDPTNTPSIPSLPISWDNGRKLMEVLKAGSPLKGKRVRLTNNVDTRVTPIWNVIGVIPGHIRDEVVLAGNHRDAWVLGAADPNGGTVSITEVIRGLGHLMRMGWKPLRTIVIASWDGEEYGLIGSTEWGEDFADWIDEHVVAYCNVDTAVAGSHFRASGSPLLAHFIVRAAQDVPHPTDTNRTLWDATTDDGSLVPPYLRSHRNDAVRVAQPALEIPISATNDLGVSPIGSGSDYTVFLQRNGVPCTDEGFTAGSHDPVYHYHSVYDSVPWLERFGDPGFPRHIAIAEHLGLQILRLASRPILPFNTTHYAIELDGYLDTIENLPETQNLGIQFIELRQAIRRVRWASWELDREKWRAERELKRAIDHWWRHHRHCYHPYPGTSVMRTCLHNIRVWLRGRPAISVTSQGQLDDMAEFYEMLSRITSQEEIYSEDLEDGDADHDQYRTQHPSKSHGQWRRALFRAIHRVRVVNKRLRSFERGFISNKGIKDREWYKHLGVAPGKWLGYGATTFPGLTEAIVFDMDKPAAEHEAKRLVHLLTKIAAGLRA